MTIKLKIDMGNAFKKIPWPSRKERRKLNVIMANKAVEVIKTRVNKGQSLVGGGFKRYSEGYRKYKQAVGRSPESPGDWLRLTGKMLAALGILEYDADHWVIGFSGSRPNTRPMTPGARKLRRRKGAKARKPMTKNVSNALLAWANDKLRPFVGLLDKEQTEVVDHTMKHWTERI
ncbi:MAG: hypothetical protein JRH07_14065 [Deltaproteobacteria bacterium]|nr:hypothetical protein [Deltaproteobacteria bacterium]